MKLLIFTQAVDLDDPVLGFFHGWLEEFALHFEEISVVCLKEGRHALPKNIRVYSLGKETGRSRIKYLFRFYRYVWQLRHEYEAVFSHMNQEYILLGGVIWKLLRKRVYLERNFATGDFLTNIGVFFSTKVFCTSVVSYTARFKKTVLTPVGVDIQHFSPGTAVRIPNSILSLGRIAPIKLLHVFVEAFGILEKIPTPYIADIYGNPLPKDVPYLKELNARVQELGIKQITFHPAITNRETVAVYGSHDIFVNLTPSGSYDKTIYEAAACGCLVVASIIDWKNLADPRLSFDGSAEDLAKTLRALLDVTPREKEYLRAECIRLAQNQSLAALARMMAAEMA